MMTGGLERTGHTWDIMIVVVEVLLMDEAAILWLTRGKIGHKDVTR
jgi:hypothetical protein